MSSWDVRTHATIIELPGDCGLCGGDGEHHDTLHTGDLETLVELKCNNCGGIWIEHVPNDARDMPPENYM